MVTSSSKINKLFSEIDVNYKKILIQNHFPYVFTKSFYFLEDGEDLYRQKDFFNLPDQSFNDNDIKLVKIGCNQIISGIGFSIENPFTLLGVREIHKLFELFHYELENQKILKTEKHIILDELRFKHKLKDDLLICYNNVEY